MPRGPFHHLSGPRLPIGPAVAIVSCFRCTVEGTLVRQPHRRLLRLVGQVFEGRIFGWVAFCSDCMAAVPPLNPDPLHVEEVA